MGEIEEFNPLTFEKRLTQLKDTQESIQSLSSWCLKQREHHKKIVASWLNVLKRVKVEQRLVLFYLANDVIQYSKRKNYDFVESWGLNLQKATPLVRDEKVRHKILRIFKIWEQRAVYDEEFLSDLTGLLSAGALKKTDDDPLDFQPQQLVNKIKQCTVLEADTDLRLKYIHESHLELSDADALCASLKDRSNKDDVEKELNEGIQCVERYTQALQREIVAREALLALLTTANQYYSTQRGEVKVVAYAYKNFGARVRALKRKLDELIPTLPNAAPSPPQRDEDVPSPGPDEDLDLPAIADNEEPDDISYNIDRTFNTSVTADGSLYNLGLSSFLSSDNPMSFLNEADSIVNNANKIEVINSRPNEKQDFDINSFLKTLVPSDSNTANSDSNSGSAIIPPADPSLPGLDLLSESNPPPPTSFYGTMNSVTGSAIIPSVDLSLPGLDLLSDSNPPPPTSLYGTMNSSVSGSAILPSADLSLPGLDLLSDSNPPPPTSLYGTMNSSITGSAIIPSADLSLPGLDLLSDSNPPPPTSLYGTMNSSITGSAIVPQAGPSLPGLDLLSDSNPPPPTSLYGTMNSSITGSAIIPSADLSLPGLDLLSDSNPLPPTSFYGTINSSITGSAIIPSADLSLPGLDLLSDSNPPPPTSLYGTMNSSITDETEYHPEILSGSTQWNSNAWSLPPAPVPPPTMPLPPPPVPVPIPNIPVSNPMSNTSNIPISTISMPNTVSSMSNPIGNIASMGSIPISSMSMPTIVLDTPESPPPAPPPPPAPIVPVYTHNTPDMPSADVDHRGLLPPPPPPPVLPLLGNIEDVDHRLLPSLPPPPPPVTTSNRHPQQDVDHRNLISLTHQPAARERPSDPRTAPLDQDYRVPPLVAPSDVVDVVDMDLSEDEDQQGMYPQNEHRRNSFNNNKVLVGGDNGKTNHKEHPNLVQINRENFDSERPHTAPVLPPMSNPFDNMPIGLKNLNMPFNKSFPQYPREDQEENSNDSAYEDDLRSRGIEQPRESPDIFDFPEDPRPQRPFNNQRFPRNWGPRTNFRPPFGGPPQRPWIGPRPPPNRWMGPRQRFW